MARMEEIAYNNRWITTGQLVEHIRDLSKNTYGELPMALTDAGLAESQK